MDYLYQFINKIMETAINKRKLIKYRDYRINFYNQKIYQGYHHNKVKDGNDLDLREGQALWCDSSSLILTNYKNGRDHGIYIEFVTF